MKTEKEILIAFLGATLNLPDERIAELLYKKSDEGAITDEILDGALDALKNLDKERVTKLKPDTKQFFDNGYKKAQAEVAGQFEKLIREKAGLETDATGEDLITAAFEKIAKPKLDDDKVKTHPLYLKLEKEGREQIEKVKSEGTAALEQFKAEQEKGQRVSMAQQKAKDILLSMKPVLEDDPKISERRIKYFLDEFKGLEYEVMENGDLVPIKGGKRLENDHKHPIEFEALVKQIAGESFKFQVQDPKGNGGNQNNPSGQGAGKVVGAPKNETELWQAYNAAPEDQKAAILEAYEKAHGEIAMS